MNWRETLKLAWENRDQISDGFWNAYIHCKPEVEKEALRRKKICESNVCGMYDPIGKKETSAIPGKPTCSACHCNIEMKVHNMSVNCGMEKLGKELYWTAVVDESQWNEIEDRKYKEQFKKNI